MNIGNILDDMMITISKTIDENDKAIETGYLRGVKISEDDIKKMKIEGDKIKEKKEELLKTLNDASNSNR